MMSGTLSEGELEWSAPTSAKKSATASPIPERRGVPATVGQARLDLMLMNDPSHAHSLCKWVTKFRTEKDWQDQELATGFLELTAKISLLQAELREMDSQAPGGPWLEKYQKSQRLAGKRDAIMDELKNRGKARALYYRHAGNTLTPSSEQPTEAKAPESDPFENV